jgi:hypothetical protein
VIVKNGWPKNLFLLMTLISSVVLLWMFLFTSEYVYAFIGLLCVVVVTIFGKIFYRQTIHNHYGHKIDTNFWGWSTSDFNKMVAKKFKKKLEKEKLNEVVKIELIVSITQNKIVNERLPTILMATVFAGLFVPLWSSYLARNIEIASGFRETSVLLVVWLLFILVIAFFSLVIVDIRDTLVTRQLKLLRFQELLNEIILKKK